MSMLLSRFCDAVVNLHFSVGEEGRENIVEKLTTHTKTQATRLQFQASGASSHYMALSKEYFGTVQPSTWANR